MLERVLFLILGKKNRILQFIHIYFKRIIDKRSISW